MQNKLYKIKNKYIKGVNIEGFTISNDEGNEKFIKSEDMIKIALSGKIENASVVLNTENSEYILEVHNGLDSIETITKLNDIMLTLQCRILDKEGVCIGYKAKDESGKSYNLTVNKTWELALGQAIYGIEALSINGIKVLKSKDGFNLKDIPKITKLVTY